MRGSGSCLLALIGSLAGCVELGMMTDGTSVSIGRPSGGHLVDGGRLPNQGEGFMTRDQWRLRNNRYGTDELLDLITGVGRQLAATGSTRLVVADLSARGGGEAKRWHRSHQSGRDVDLVYFMRDADGKPFEADAMRVFDADGKARDGSGITVDVPRMWDLVKALISAPEANVQWAFIYEPIAQKLLAYAVEQGEPEAVIARARMTMRQPGDSAPHHDHIHVRVYCSPRDRGLGCVDIGPMGLLADREAERRRDGELPLIFASLVASTLQAGTTEALGAVTEADVVSQAGQGPGNGRALVRALRSGLMPLPWR